MVDYRLNIQANSVSKAPFNLWPYQLKFCLMRPILIYRSKISTVNDSINTEVFPGRDQAQLYSLDPLDKYAKSRNLTLEKIKFLAELLDITGDLPDRSKLHSLKIIQNHVINEKIAPDVVADKVATALYLQDIQPHITKLPEPLRRRITDLSTPM